jgi:uncharacterized protein YllA (UPF0747 family)
MESAQRLRQPESVVVVTSLYLSFLGGPVSQILKCLTAIKVCGELAKRQLTAVPVCWLRAGSPPGFAKLSINLLGDDSELHCLELRPSEPAGVAPGARLPADGVSGLLSEIEKLGRGTFDGDFLRLLKAEFVGATFSSASARLAAALMKGWGMIVLEADAPALAPILLGALAPVRNETGKMRLLVRKQTSELAEAGYGAPSPEDDIPAILAQSLSMPVIACVLDPYEIYSYARSLPVWAEVGLPRPLAWPQSSATLLDVRSRRILQRHNLSLRQLYSGEEEVMREMRGRMPGSAPGKLDSLKRTVEAQLAELESLAGGEWSKAAHSSGRKIVYQLEKLREQFESALARKEQAVRRQVRRVCNFLAPNRRAQERELAGIQIPLRYSHTGLRSLYEKLDILKFEHQLIPMD